MTSHAADDVAIHTETLSRTFGDPARGDGTVAVDELTLDVYGGEVFGFLGHNGSGKTTTVRLLNGVLAPSGGTMRVLGYDPMDDGPTMRRHTGVLTETPSLDEKLSARENLTIYARLYGVAEGAIEARVDRLLKEFELDDRATEMVGGYSRGMKQRLALARTLLHNPPLIFLDEPTAGLDPVAARRVQELITRLSRRGGAHHLPLYAQSHGGAETVSSGGGDGTRASGRHRHARGTGPTALAGGASGAGVGQL